MCEGADIAKSSVGTFVSILKCALSFEPIAGLGTWYVASIVSITGSGARVDSIIASLMWEGTDTFASTLEFEFEFEPVL